MTYYSDNKGYSIFKVITCIRNTFTYEFSQDVRPSFPFRPVIDLLTSITFPWRPKGRQATRPVVSPYTPRSSAWRPLGRQGQRPDICLYLSLSNRSHDYRISPFYLSLLVLQPYATGLSESRHSPFGAWRVATRTTIEYRFRRRQLSTRRVWDRFFRLADARRSGEAERILISTLAV